MNAFPVLHECVPVIPVTQTTHWSKIVQEHAFSFQCYGLSRVMKLGILHGVNGITVQDGDGSTGQWQYTK
jgi:hypothetical protein